MLPPLLMVIKEGLPVHTNIVLVVPRAGRVVPTGVFIEVLRAVHDWRGTVYGAVGIGRIAHNLFLSLAQSVPAYSGNPRRHTAEVSAGNALFEKNGKSVRPKAAVITRI